MQLYIYTYQTHSHSSYSSYLYQLIGGPTWGAPPGRCRLLNWWVDEQGDKSSMVNLIVLQAIVLAMVGDLEHFLFVIYWEQ